MRFINKLYVCDSDIIDSPGFDSLLLCPAFTDFEFMNWSAEGGTGEVQTVCYVCFVLSVAWYFLF